MIEYHILLIVIAIFLLFYGLLLCEIAIVLNQIRDSIRNLK